MLFARARIRLDLGIQCRLRWIVASYGPEVTLLGSNSLGVSQPPCDSQREDTMSVSPAHSYQI
jgi:hypothetical protein